MNAKRMSREELLSFVSFFEAARCSLLQRRGAVSNESFCPQGDDLLDLTDLAATELETSMRVHLQAREAFYLKKVEEALRRISAGTFGQCHECDQAIEVTRLMARPTATLCLECKEQQESNENHYQDGLRPKFLRQSS